MSTEDYRKPPTQVTMPGGYRLIASGDVVPFFYSNGTVVLHLHDDGTVTWTWEAS